MWSKNYQCEDIQFRNGTEGVRDLLTYDNKVMETGNFALDIASLKIHYGCARRDDLKVESYSSKDYFNFSLIGDPKNPTLVVDFHNLEKRLFDDLERRRDR